MLNYPLFSDKGYSSIESVFDLPVDAEGKATQFRPFSVATPHMRAFHLAWLSLFSCFFSTFSIPPLLPVIRGELNLSADDIARAGVASFAGSVLSRLAMGPACDLVGPRMATATVSLLTAPAIMATTLATSPWSFIVVRFVVGFSLATFVSNQYWISSMFAGRVVGLANGVSAGWANAGSGITQLVMPLIYSFFNSLGMRSSASWRVAFMFPAMFQATMAILVLKYGEDSPSQNYKRAGTTGNKQNENFFGVLFHGLKNYRGWILGLTYGASFGVELTTDNIIAQYFYDRFGVDLQVAGAIAASFGVANFFSRPGGGMLSDLMGRSFGIRGRLWGLWLVLNVAGLLCVLLGRVKSLWGSVVVLCCFSVSVQAASGLTFGVVPFVSKRSLGVIAGMTGSGGTVGAVVTQMLLFSGSKFSTSTSISRMGMLMILCSLPLTLIYFPQWGGMFCTPTAPENTACEDDRLDS